MCGMKLPKYVFAIDAGATNLGLAIYPHSRDACVSLPEHLVCLTAEPRNKAKESLAASIIRQCAQLSRSLNHYRQKYRPAFVCAEIPSGGAQSASAMRGMACATALLASWCAAHSIDLLPVTPTEIKRLVKRGSVSKDDVSEMLETTYAIRLPRTKAIREHVADAVAAYVVASKKFSAKFHV